MGEPSDPKLIRFPGSAPTPAPAPTAPAADGAGQRLSPAGSGQLGLPGLSADQEKAIGLVVSGKSFVLVAIQPAGDGADFFTAIDGQRREVADAAPHLAGVIERALLKRGIVS